MAQNADQPTAPDDVEAGADQTIAACDGDPRAAVNAQIIANAHMRAEIDALSAEVAAITDRVSKAYARDPFLQEFEPFR